MKWTILLGFWCTVTFAHAPMVFMRDSAAGKHVILRQGSTETALTSGDMWHLYPDISADGQWVVWVEGPSERDLSVVLYNTRTRSRERWSTGRKGSTLHPRFTKNGQQIFFSAPERGGNKIVSFSPANSRTRLLALEADGTKVYRISPDLVPHDGQGFSPRPSADGTFVVFQRNTLFNKDILEYNLLTKQTRVIAAGTSPALSADDNWILYTTKVQGSWDVWLINRLTGDSASLTNDPEDEMDPTFTALNNVAFASNRNKRFQLYHLENGEWQQLVKSDGDDSAPMFAGEAQWQQGLATPLPTPRRSAFASAQLAGRIYVCGGLVENRATNRLDVYDQALGRWSELATRPRAEHSFPLVAFGPYLYAFGETLDRYDTRSDVWVTLASLPRASKTRSAVAIAEKVYMLESENAEVVVLDLLTEKLTIAPWRLAPRRGFSAIGLDDHIVVVGDDARVTLLDPTSGFGREFASLPFAMTQPSLGVLGDDLLVFGGVTGEKARAGIYALSFSKNTWRQTGRFLTEAKGLSQVVPFAGGLAILGGQRSLGTGEGPLATFELFRRLR
jgi:hypothetical protein